MQMSSCVASNNSRLEVIEVTKNACQEIDECGSREIWRLRIKIVIELKMEVVKSPSSVTKQRCFCSGHGEVYPLTMKEKPLFLLTHSELTDSLQIWSDVPTCHCSSPSAGQFQHVSFAVRSFAEPRRSTIGSKLCPQQYLSWRGIGKC